MLRTRWADLEEPTLSPAVLEVIDNFGFEHMTPVQIATIPRFLSRNDVSVEAVTGSGKTLAFLVPLMEMLLHRQKETPWQTNDIPGLIITPTRELAQQISEVLLHFLDHRQFKFVKHLLIVGGNSMESDIKSLMAAGPHIVVGTPGRLEDLFQRKSSVNLSARVRNLEVLILDEADRLLDLGFKSSINRIFQYLPRQRRTGLFSATQTTEVIDLIRAGLRNPITVSVKEKASVKTPARLQNFYQLVEPEQKFVTLLQFLKLPNVEQQKIIIFFPTCACVEYWLEILSCMCSQKTILGIHGKMLLKKRRNIVEQFRKLRHTILLSTDVLARGLDVPEIDWVVQWDPPTNAKSFVHRIGRTARQGNVGSALVFLLPTEDAYINFLEINQKVELSKFDVGSTEKSVELQSTLKAIHQLQRADKALYDKGIRAFVSHIRAYSKHECSAILRVKDLDLGKVATSYGLLQMPRMPELTEFNVSGFISPDFDVDVMNLNYKDKQKEKKRIEKLKEFEKNGFWPRKKILKCHTESWAETNKAKLEKKNKRRLRKMKKREKLETDSSVRKRKQQYSKEDLEELATDISLFKKFKKNKISRENYEEAMGISD